MQIDGTQYEMFVASDVNQGSMQFECYRCNDQTRKLMMEVIRYDTERRFVVVQHEKELPLALLEHVARVARLELGPFFGESSTQQSTPQYQEEVSCEASQEEGLVHIKVVAMPYVNPIEFNWEEARIFGEKVLAAAKLIEGGPQ